MPPGPIVAAVTGREHPRARRRRRAVAALVLALAASGCTTTTGGAPGEGEGGPPADYATTMGEICATARARVASLPDPPDGISRRDWANEVGLALRAEGTSLRQVPVDDARREDHRALTAGTLELADRWTALADELEGGEPEAIGELTDDIGQLTLGRDELADALGLPGCRAAAPLDEPG